MGLCQWMQIGTADGRKCFAVDVACFVDGGGGRCSVGDAEAWTHTACPSHYLWLKGCSGRERRARLTAVNICQLAFYWVDLRFWF